MPSSLLFRRGYNTVVSLDLSNRNVKFWKVEFTVTVQIHEFDKFCRLNAFHSRRGLSSIEAIASRLYQLSSGLRREVPATHAFQALWAEHIGHRLNEEVGEKLDGLVDEINTSLDGSEIKEGCREALEQSLATYEETLARRVGGSAARLDTLQKALPCVAEILRSRPTPDVPLDPPDEDHEGHHHHH